MMCRKQKTAEAGYPMGGRVELEVPQEVRSIGTPETAEGDSGEPLESLGFMNMAKYYEALHATH